MNTVRNSLPSYQNNTTRNQNIKNIIDNMTIKPGSSRDAELK